MTKFKETRLRFRVMGGAFLILLAAAVILAWLSGRLATQEPYRSDIPLARSRSSAGTGARHSRARESNREARFDESFAFFRDLPAEQWEAGDCVALSSALLDRDRNVLGWAALEAAKRIDPKDGSAFAALDDLQSKLALAKGAERVKWQESVGRVEMLRSVSGGPELGMLVLVLARYAKDAEQEDEFLDRIWVRDRAVLRGVKSTVDSLKLGARLLLETGRAAEAHALLENIVPSPRGNSASSSTAALAAVDREAAWLMSRAALQLDQQTTADAMLALAGDYGKDQTTRPEPAPFVGSRGCGECHRRLYREQQKSSRHASTLRFGSSLKDVPLPAHPVPDPVIPRILFSFARGSDERIAVESRAGDRIVRAVVDYALGSGRHGITMVARDDEGVARELRVSYFGEGQTWGETKGVRFAPHDPGDQIGLELGRQNLNQCLHCHATWFRSVKTGVPGPRGPEAGDHGIGCERCHGPGLNHVKAVSSGFAELAIALTSATPSIDQLRSCTGCHASDGTVPPSDPEFTRAQGTTFLFSRCFIASKGTFRCTTCHDPHLPVETAASHYEAKCLNCHAETLPPRDSDHQSAGAPKHGRQTMPSCPVSPGKDCLACHMPRVEDRSRRSRFTDHHIRTHPELAAAHALQPRP
jgi:Cytochrome c554 and c-prime